MNCKELNFSQEVDDNSTSCYKDLTDNRDIIDELEESEGKYKAIFNGGKSIMLIINPATGNIVDANPAAQSYYGYSIDELKSMNIQQINAFPEDVVKDKMQKAKYGKEKYFLFQHRLANGCIRDVEVYSGKIVINNIELLYSIIHDITESKRNEERLQKAEKVANIGSWEIDVSTEEVFVSAGAKKIYGTTEENITLDYIRSFPLKQYRDKLNNAYRQLIDNNIPYDVEFKICRASDGAIIDIHSIAKYRKDSHTVFGVLHDITQRKKTEEDLRKAKEKAEEADRLKSAFLATVSHELRTPLNAIIGLSDVIDKNMKINEILEMTSIINSSGYNLLEIIDTILDISLVETAKFKINNERFLLSRLFDDIKSFVEREAIMNRDVDITHVSDNNVSVSVFADYTRIRKVLRNLLKNAIKFTERGNIEYGYKISEDSVIFYVKDTGIGIPENKKEILFESFRQLDDKLTRKYEGIGLGLTVCKKIADVLKGDIWVESEESGGSVFYFKLNNLDVSYL